MIGPLAALAASLSVASIVWLFIYRVTQPQQALKLILLMLLCLAVELAGWVGVRWFPAHRIWPGACMLAAAPAAVYSGVAGAGALLGFGYGIIGEMLAGYVFEPLYYAALPAMVVAMVCGLGLAVAGALWLVQDVQELLGIRQPAPPPATLADLYYEQPGQPHDEEEPDGAEEDWEEPVVDPDHPTRPPPPENLGATRTLLRRPKATKAVQSPPAAGATQVLEGIGLPDVQPPQPEKPAPPKPKKHPLVAKFDRGVDAAVTFVSGLFKGKKQAAPKKEALPAPPAPKAEPKADGAADPGPAALPAPGPLATDVPTGQFPAQKPDKDDAPAPTAGQGEDAPPAVEAMGEPAEGAPAGPDADTEPQAANAGPKGGPDDGQA